MSYIGKEPQIGAYSMLDNLTASATASYSLTLDSVAFVPESANHLIVSLNGVIQKAGSSFTVSGSTLTFSSALTSSDSIDFILSLGNVLDIGTPSDATVTNAKTNFVSTSSAAGLQIKGDGTTDGTLQLNCSQNSHGVKIKSPPHSAAQSYTLTLPSSIVNDQFLKTDGSGNLSFASAGGANTPIFAVQLTPNNQSLTSNSLTLIQFNSVEIDTASGWTGGSDYKWTVPSNQGGKYVLSLSGNGHTPSNNVQDCRLELHKNGSRLLHKQFYSFSADHRHQPLHMTHVVTLAAGDYIQGKILVNASSASLRGDANETFMSGFKLIE